MSQHRALYIALAAVVMGLLAFALPFASRLKGEIVGIEPGSCSGVDPDPVTGQRLVYCCLDELYLMQQEGQPGEADMFLKALQATTNLSVADGIAFFQSPYDSSVHRKYGWNTFCGAQVSCDLCVMGPQCGNNALQSGEECDDGNLNSGDGCNSACALEAAVIPPTVEESSSSEEVVVDIPIPEPEPESSSAVSSVASSAASVIINPCGNYKIDAGEECDDGNRLNGDGCSMRCTVELRTLRPAAGSARSAGNPSLVATGQPSIVLTCGNGVLNVGEQCDSGTANDAVADRCRPDCLLPFCGDGIVDTGELCDDGNAHSGDGCDTVCKTEGPPSLIGEVAASSAAAVVSSEAASSVAPVVASSAAPVVVSSAPAQVQVSSKAVVAALPMEVLKNPKTNSLCGNGIIEEPEECDDRNALPADGCTATCKTEAGFQYALMFSGTAAVCGNGHREGREQCDDGNLVLGDGCSPQCRIESTLISGSALCGNGKLDGGEECDDGNINDADGCTATCFWEKGSLGDARVERALGERCEPALHDSSLAYGCTTVGLMGSECGNGLLDPGEECDAGDGNSTAADAICRPNCRRTGCGDGVLDSGEQCDDGNLVSTDGCNRFCLKGGGTRGVTQAAVIPGTSNLTEYNVAYQQEQQVAAQHAAAGPLKGTTGPEAVIVMGAGAALGWALIRRRKLQA